MYADTLMAGKLGLAMGLVPSAVFRELERTTRNSNQNVILDAWRPVLEGDLEGITATERALEDALRSIDVPYLALHGRPVEAGYQKWFEAANRAAKFEYWPGLGHWLHLVKPDRFAGRVTQFIAESGPPHSF
jgi:pimeloyl-ACP methyl ester carboxylesterase